MIIDVSSTEVVKVYKLLVGVVTPRPIAWVTTIDGEGRVNLAPFSFFNAFGANPPVVVFSPTLAAGWLQEGHPTQSGGRPGIRLERGRRGPGRPDEPDGQGAAARPERG